MINKDLNFYIKNYNSFIDKDICNQTIKELSQNENEFIQHTFYSLKENNARTVSGDKELDITTSDTSTKKFIMDKIWQALTDYMKHIQLPYFDGWAGYSSIRWNRYKETRQMAEHCDHIQSLFEGQRRGVPILSCLGSLNDDYEGGELVFFGGETIEFKQGDLLIFPSNFLYPHRVEPVTNGTRWSYISWVW